MDDHTPHVEDTTNAALHHVAAAILAIIDAAGPTGAPLEHVRVDLLTHGASPLHYDAFMRAITSHGYITCDLQGRAGLTSYGRAYLTALTRTLEPFVEAPGLKDWAPVYTKWRHGGWYVVNVPYPSGAAGCVSRQYPDGRWRIVCDERRSDIGAHGDFTFPNRDAAARAEHALAIAQAKWAACDADPAAYLLSMLAPPAGLEEGSAAAAGAGPFPDVDPRQQKLFD